MQYNIKRFLSNYMQNVKRKFYNYFAMRVTTKTEESLLSVAFNTHHKLMTAADTLPKSIEFVVIIKSVT